MAAGRPFLGICVGMQMLYEGSDESPGVAGLGVLPGRVQRLPDGGEAAADAMEPAGPGPAGASDGAGPGPGPVGLLRALVRPAGRRAAVVATCEYGGPVVAAVARDRVWATQFHPEKSGPVGLALLANFVAAVAAAEAAAAGPSGTGLGLSRPVELYPAIDLRGGRCVRLVEGDFARETVYSDDPVAVARAFAAAGARWIHVVDLDGARTGVPVNRRGGRAGSRPRSAGAASGSRPAVGSARAEDAEELLAAGVARVVVGTAAVERPRPGGRDRRPAGPGGWPSASTTATARCGCGAGPRAAAGRSPSSCPRRWRPARPR